MDINDVCNMKTSTPNKYWKGTVEKVSIDSKNNRYVSIIYTVGFEATRTKMLKETEFIFEDDEYWQK